jgi:uncharacterized protein (TIGR02246 family)
VSRFARDGKANRDADGFSSWRTMRDRLLSGSALAIALGTAACHAASTSAPAASYDALTAATQHYAAMLRGAPADSVAAAFTADGELILPGMAPLRGRPAIAKFLAPMAASTVVASVQMVADSQRVAGTMAQQDGHYVQVAGPRGGAAQTYRGTYDALWRRETDGRWRFVRLTMRPAP